MLKNQQQPRWVYFHLHFAWAVLVASVDMGVAVQFGVGQIVDGDQCSNLMT